MGPGLKSHGLLVVGLTTIAILSQMVVGVR